MANLTQNGFGNWLLRHRVDEIVGFPEDRSDCPLCRYIRSLGVQDPAVDLTYYKYFPRGTVVTERIAEWATKFQYDSMDLVGTKTDALEPITAEQAIQALNTDFGKKAFRHV